ncbi:MAG: hypothetical protein AB7F75_07820 [Planctomycetota bacterium]
MKLKSSKLIVVVCLFLAGTATLIYTSSSASSGPPSIKAKSSEFATLHQKIDCLEKQILFRRHYESLEFDINTFNGGDSIMPSPSEWDIKLAAKVPSSELNLWTKGLREIVTTDTVWLKDIPSGVNWRGISQWFTDEDGSGESGKVVGVDSKRSIVVYRIFAH